MAVKIKWKRLHLALVIALGCFIGSINLFPANGDTLIFTKTGQLHSADYDDIFINGNYAYCATRKNGIDVIDIGSPSKPQIIANYDCSGFICAKGKYAYTADMSTGFRILDVSNPLAPAAVGTCKLSGEPYDEVTSIYVDGNYAYVTLLYSGLTVVDMSNMQAPIVAGSFTYESPCRSSDCDDPISAYKVVVSGNYAYLADFVLGLLVVDVSDPAKPRQAEWQNLGCNIYDLRVKGDWLYLAAGRRGMLVMDISQPSSPSEAGTYPPPGEGYYDALGIYISANYGYIAFGSAGLYIVDITDPTSPASVGSYELSGYYEHVSVKGNYAYVTSDYKVDLLVLDITKPSTPTLAGEWDNLDKPYRLYVSGNYAYIADYDSGLMIVDISDPSAPETVGSYDAPGNERGIFVKDNYAYLLVYQFPNSRGGMYILDVSRPSSPAYMAYCEVASGVASGIYVEGDYSFIADGSSGNGMTVMDISDPSSPSVVGTYSGGMSYDIAVRNGYAYIALGKNGLHVVNVSDPGNPYLEGKYQHEGFNNVNDISLKDDYAYITMEHSGIIVLDVSHPFLPKKVAEWTPPTGGGLGKIYISGDYAYVTANQYGMYAVNISNPTAPVSAGGFKNDSNWSTDIFVKNDHVYVTDYDAFYILEAKTSTVPTAVLTITSSPAVGTNIQVSPVDNSGNAQGTTPFSRTYDTGTTVTLTAPETFDDMKFSKWEIGSQDFFETGVQVTLNADTQATAVYSSTASIMVKPSHLVFGAASSGLTTGGQMLRVKKTGTGSISWSIDVIDQGWITCSTFSGTNDGLVTITVNPTGLSSGTYTGIIYFKHLLTGEQLDQVEVTFNVYSHNASGVPFGEFATPLEGSTVRSSIPVCGWAVDDIGVNSVQIFREEKGAQIYIGDAVFVEGARPDVATAYPGYPNNTKAGWGYMLLTNFLPNSGNGVFKLLVIATDIEGNQVTLGTRTITCDNANAVKPFGAIDTPEQGGFASGKSYLNWGWALTPQPNAIPIDGSTLNVFVDGIKVGNPTYNLPREDIIAYFPGYANTNGAVGYLYLDTTKYENGVHTIQWTATDDAGNTDGIGSRYFTVQNSGNNRYRTAGHDVRQTNDNILPTRVPHEGRAVSIDIKELERVVIDLSEGETVIQGYSVTGSGLDRLPVGSTLKDNIFHWSPGPGYVGEYRFVFLLKQRNGGILKKTVKITIEPKGF